MATVLWGPEIASVYDSGSPDMFSRGLPAGGRARRARRQGAALEFAVGTGRVALPLSGRGVPVAGIELSPDMAAVLRAKPGAAAVPVTIGDMASTRVPGAYSLVYLVFNTIMNVTTQDEQVAVFENAAAHLAHGGRFVVEVGLPAIAGLPATELGRVFDVSPGHVGIDTIDDPVAQITSSHHWTLIDGQWRRSSAPYRYVWPSELDLMARIAGFRLEHRWAGWDKSPFTGSSTSQVAVYQKQPDA